MPTRIRMQLERGSTKNEKGSTGIIKILARLCDQDRSVEAVYLCNPAVQRINKTNKEGNLCGYRNIQMIITYIIGAGAQGSEHFPNGLPSVLDLQDLIEEAWDKGINSQGRVETGGLKGTRKYIGTPEVRNPKRSNLDPSDMSTLPILALNRIYLCRLKHSFAASELAARPVLTTAQRTAPPHGNCCSSL